jgi:hypothetical protein
MTNDQLLAEIEDALRTAPSRTAIDSNDADLLPWEGRVAAIVRRWDFTYSPECDMETHQLHTAYFQTAGLTTLMKLLYQARAHYQMEAGLSSVVVPPGHVFDYFDELRKVIQLARAEVFFVDPYLDAEFVPRYLPHIAGGVAVKLLGGPKRIATLLPAVDMFVQQYKRSVSVRTSGAFHDRFLFVDHHACYQSGASFKDGAKKAPTTLTQITDAFSAMLAAYESIWNAAKVER